jgi:hypothetical protein
MSRPGHASSSHTLSHSVAAQRPSNTGNLLSAGTRNTFRAALPVDDATWARGRGSALSFGLIAPPTARAPTLYPPASPDTPSTKLSPITSTPHDTDHEPEETSFHGSSPWHRPVRTSYPNTWRVPEDVGTSPSRSAHSPRASPGEAQSWLRRKLRLGRATRANGQPPRSSSPSRDRFGSRRS